MISFPANAANAANALEWFLPESGGDCAVKLIEPICPETFFFFVFAYTVAALKGGNVLGAMVMKLLSNFHLVWK